MRVRDHEAEELSFYSKATSDIEFLFPFGWGELWGIADRTNYDLSRHMEVTGEDLTYFDEGKKQKYIPFVIEPSLLTVWYLHSSAAHTMRRISAQKRNRICVQFFISIRHWLLSRLVYSHYPRNWVRKQNLSMQNFQEPNCEYDDRGNIGKRYRRQDEIGTPFCVTYDFDSEEDGCVTVRDRDTMEQERVKIEDLTAYFMEKLAY
ncbi:MAG: His/Gly/Thr/Pro-type tRNA ligase C-terminal domain-containing protein [Coprococcus sp.]